MIELLAVIVIMAVVAMITTPIVIGIIEDSKERANRRSVDGLVRAGQIYLAQSLQDPNKASNIEQEQDLIDQIAYEGKRPEEGQIYVRPDGKIALAVQYDKKCYKKEYEGKIETLPYSMKNCKLNIHIERPTVKITVPENVFNEMGWSKENFTVTIEGTDYSGLGVTLKWCGTENDSCEPNTEIKQSTGQIQISQETRGMKICAKAIDGFLNESEVMCSRGYKLDKTAPTFTGLEEIRISEKNLGDFLFGVVAEDNLSGVNGSIAYSPASFDMSHAYNTTAEYRVEDQAGNIETATRNVRVGTEAPDVTFTPTTGSINTNGWARANFYVTVGASDYSSTGIKEIHWCGTTSNTCEPSSSISENLNAYIQTEGDHNRICAYAVDNFDQRGEVTCSDSYKLDKTAPEFTGIGDIQVARNQVANLTNGVSASDSLSGIDGTYSYTPATVDTSKAGETTVTYRVTDKAGNNKEITRKVVIATEAPAVSYRLANPSDVNQNGWAKSNFYVTINTTDYSGHGIDKIVWCGTTGNTCNPTSEVKATSHSVMISTESSNNRICAYAVDKYGQQGSTTCSDAYKLDKTAPTAGTFNASGTMGKNGWYISNISLSPVNGSDSLSGHASTIISHTGLTTDTAGTTVTITTTDLAGNMASRTATYKLDKTAPTKPRVIARYNNGSGATYTGSWTNQNVWVQVSSTDNLSGIAQYYQTKAYTGGEDLNFSGTITYTEEGTRSYHYRAEDQAGNSSEWTWPGTSDDWIGINIDRTAPTAPTTMNFVHGDWSRYNGGWTNQDVYAADTISNQGPSGASDTLSGISRYQISTDNINWQDYGYTGAGIYFMSTDGIHTRYFRTVDQAGNASGSISRTAYIDKTAPTAPTTMNFVHGDWSRYNGGWTNQDVYAADTISNQGPSGGGDSLSGISRYQISTDNINWQDYGYTGAGIYFMSTDGIHTRYFRTVDQAGNVSSSISRTAYIDKTPPVFTGLSQLNVLSGDGTDLTSGVNVSDTLSGIKGNYTYSPTTVSTSNMGTTVITYQAVDQAGNVATATRNVVVTAYQWLKYNAIPTVTYYWDQYGVTYVTKSEVYYVGGIKQFSTNLLLDKYFFSSGFEKNADGSISYQCSPCQSMSVFSYWDQGAYNKMPYMTDENKFVYEFYRQNPSRPHLIDFKEVSTRNVRVATQGNYITTVTSTNASLYPNNAASGSYWYVSKPSVTTYSKGTVSYGNATSTNINSYPANGRHSDGYWYVRK